MPVPADIPARAQLVLDRCWKLASFSEDPHAITRTFLSSPMHECHAEILSWLQPIGTETYIDAVGNLRGLFRAPSPTAPRLLIGSHLDTVPNAGAFDGVLGVVLAVALLEALQGTLLPFSIEFAAFSEEEGVRFGIPFIGSRALVGRVDDDLLNRRDAGGISVRAAIEQFGLNPSKIPDALLHPNTLGFLEFHIEQGPVLESLQLPLAAVEAVAGQTRMEFTFSGRSNHAGTTPMSLRRDSVTAAAEWTLAVEQTARNVPELVATVGQVDPKPGASNVIAGETRLSLDVRHKSDEVRAAAVSNLIRQAQDVAARRGLFARHALLLNQRAVTMDSFLTAQIETAIRSSGCQPHRMTSGAGHDAMILAEKVPAAIIFLRTPGGISHHPDESVSADDVAKALEIGLHLLHQLASSPEFLRTP